MVSAKFHQWTVRVSKAVVSVMAIVRGSSQEGQVGNIPAVSGVPVGALVKPYMQGLDQDIYILCACV